MKTEIIKLGSGMIRIPSTEKFKSLVFDFISEQKIGTVKSFSINQQKDFSIVSLVPSARCEELFIFIENKVDITVEATNIAPKSFFFNMERLFKPFNRR